MTSLQPPTPKDIAWIDFEPFEAPACRSSQRSSEDKTQ